MTRCYWTAADAAGWLLETKMDCFASLAMTWEGRGRGAMFG
jgi:hypothetical protein